MNKHILLKLLSEIPSSSQQFPPNHREFIHSPEHFWIVESGEGELFAMEGGEEQWKQGNKETGPLTFIGHIQETFALFGFALPPDAPVNLILLTTSAMVLRRIAWNDFKNWMMRHPEEVNTIKTCFQAWLFQVDTIYQSFQKDSYDYFIDVGQTITLKIGETLAPFLSPQPELKERVIWIEVTGGNVELVENTSVSFSSSQGFFPLSPSAWVRAKENVTVRALRLEEVLVKEAFWKGLQFFQQALFTLVVLYVKTKEFRNLEKVLERDILNQAALREGVKKLSEVLLPEEPFALPKIQDPLLRACNIVGHKEKLHFIAPIEGSDSSTLEGRLREICTASSLRFRKVMLTPGWWKEDCLHLLGFYAETGQPVALINRSSSHYEIIDPVSEKQEKIDRSNAKLLSNEAYTFYTPFPEKKLTGFSILKFCLRGRKRELLQILSIGILGALLSLLLPYLTKLLFDNVIEKYNIKPLWQLIPGMLLVACSTTIFLVTRAFAVLRLSQLIDLKLESALWDRILSLPVHFFRPFTVGDLIQRVYSVTEMRDLVSQNALKVMISGLFSIFYFFAMIAYSGSLAWAGFLIVNLSLLISALCSIKKALLERKILAINGALRGIVVQLITGISKLRVAGAESRAFAHWGSFYSQTAFLQLKAQKFQNIVTVITALLPTLSTAVLFMVVVQLMYAHAASENHAAFTIGTFVAFLAAYVPFSQAVFDACNTLINMITVLPLWERSKVILNAEPETGSDRTKPGKLKGDITVGHISFRYDKESPYILKDVSLYAHPGEFIAIVGTSGSGKSTLVRLLLGFETPDVGSIFYNGKELAGLDLGDVRRQIGTVLQNGTLLSGSIYENIVCGGVYTKEEIDHAILLSGFDKDLADLPMGLHTIMQSGGGTFSGGQVQRLLICRALVANPKILIFDEATNALDNQTQELVTKNLESLRVTRIVIAHRLSTVRNADRIYVLDKGEIVQTGTFNELIQVHGIFSEMAKRQHL